MKPISRTIFLAVLLTVLISCTDTYHFNMAPMPVETNYPGVMEVQKTNGQFAKTRIAGTSLKAGNYKIILFPKQLELKSYYVQVDIQGDIEVEYQLNDDIAVEPGYDGTVFGVLQIINESRAQILHVPVGYLP